MLKAFEGVRPMLYGIRWHKRLPPRESDKFPGDGFADFYVKQGDKQIKLHTYRYPAATPKVKAVVMLVSGYALYTPFLYTDYARTFANHGICTIGYDIRGIGRSEGIPGYTESFDQVLSDASLFLQEARKADPLLRSPPLFIMGHSIGAMVASYFAIKAPEMAKGLIVLTPLLNGGSDLPWYIRMLKHMGPLVHPFRTLEGFRFRGEKNASIKWPFIAACITDPLIYHGKVRLGTYISMEKGVEEVITNLEKMKTPYVLYHGDKDTLAPLDSAKAFHEKSGATGKELRIMSGGNHYSFFDEKNRTTFAEEIAAWINKTTSS